MGQDAVVADFTIIPEGAFSLRESVEFGFGQRHSERFDGVMRLAFVLDGLEHAVGVEVTQDAGGVHGDIRLGPATPVEVIDPAAVRAQVARVLSLDHDARGYEAIGERDPVVARLLEVAPGLRPPLFHSPYEAAFWSIISARRPTSQMIAVRDRLAREHGTVIEVAGREVAAVPTPAQLRDVVDIPDLGAEKVGRLHALADAAAGDLLDVARLRELGSDVCADELRVLPGIGPFYASLIVIRAIGFTDVLPREEPHLRAAVGAAYQLDHGCTPDDLERIAEQWRPFRTWVSVLFRAAAPRLADPASEPA